MYPELFVINCGYFVWVVKSYSFFYFFAIFLTVGGTFWLALKRGFEKEKIILFLLCVSFGGLIGARILHFLTNRDAYFSGGYSIFSLSMEGFAVSGGLTVAMLIGWIVSRKLKLDFWKLADNSVIFLGMGIALARVGCFLNGCCFGEKTTSPWGVYFPELSQAHQYQLVNGIGSFFSVSAVHPTQIYEALAALCGSLLAIYFIKKQYPTGVAAVSFVVWYYLFRLFNMQLRVMPSTFNVPDFFYPLLYLSTILCCLFLLYKKLKINKDH